MMASPRAAGAGSATSGSGPEPPRASAQGAASGFDQRVYAAVALIPGGQLATYGQIAELIGAWGCARQVGWALRRLSLPSPIPWHRVVNAAGRIAMTPSREGSDWIQRELLLAEGIPVDSAGRLPLARFRWRPELLPGPIPPAMDAVPDVGSHGPPCPSPFASRALAPWPPPGVGEEIKADGGQA